MTRVDPRKIFKHASYNIKELSKALEVSTKTCHRWIDEGMAIVQGQKKPILIRGDEVKRFLQAKNQKHVDIKLERHEFYCLKCRAARQAKRGSINKIGNVRKGICSACNGNVSRTFHPIKKDYNIPTSPTQMSILDMINNSNKDDKL